MLLGVVRPMVVLPEREYTEQMLEDILRHELTHYRRGDVVHKWFAVAVYSLHWFNPITLLVRRELERECELSCDERLLRDMDRNEKQSYGETLLSLAATRALPRQVVATTLVTEKRNLKERLEHIMRFKRKGPATIALAMALLLLLCGCGAVAGPQTTAAPETAATAAPAPDKAAGGTVNVSTVDEFLAAIGPDTTIVFAPGMYDLSKAADYGKTGGEYYSWTESYDGPELTISKVTGLTLRAQEDTEGDVTISAVPRYADVLYFKGCKDIALYDLTVGHTQEPGQCAGGVLNFDYCDNVLVNDCELYGCGIMGVQAKQCRTLHVTDTHIYDCSYGAVQLESCRDVLFDDCEIDGCYAYTGLFEFIGCTECAVINSEISQNTAFRLVYSSYSSGIYLGALEVENNTFEHSMFGVAGKPVTLEGCDLLNNTSTFWYGSEQDGDSVRCVAPDGTELDEAALSAMKRSNDVKWTAKPEEKPAAAPTVSEDGAVHVSNVDELLSAIAPGAKIYLEDGVYDLSTAANYGTYTGKYYSWDQIYDGPQLTISGVDGLTIMAAGPDKATVSAVPRYAEVLRFMDCDDLTLSGFTAGHTEAPGECSGGVLSINDCDRTRIESCSLFGCGIMGISATDCAELTVTGTEIYDCSYGAVNINSCDVLSFEGCDIHGCGTPEVSIYDSENAKYDGAVLKNGSYVLEDGKPREWTAMDDMFKMADNLGETVGDMVISVRSDFPEGRVYSPVFTDFYLRVGVDTVTLAGIATEDGKELADVSWSCSDNTALSLTPGDDGISCTATALKAVQGGVTLTAESGGKSCSVTVYCLPPA